MLYQTSFGIPAEGVYTGLIVVLLCIIAALMIIVYLLATRNVRLVEDNREVTKDAIKGFQNVISALNAIREQLQIGDNAIMGKINDTQKQIDDKVLAAQREIIAHLQYLRDRTR